MCRDCGQFCGYGDSGHALCPVTQLPHQFTSDMHFSGTTSSYGNGRTQYFSSRVHHGPASWGEIVIAAVLVLGMVGFILHYEGILSW